MCHHGHGSRANWHPHLHLLVTDGGFRPDGTFVPLPLHDVTTLTEAFRLAVLCELPETARVPSSHWLDPSSSKGDTWDRGKQIPIVTAI